MRKPSNTPMPPGLDNLQAYSGAGGVWFPPSQLLACYPLRESGSTSSVSELLSANRNREPNNEALQMASASQPAMGKPYRLQRDHRGKAAENRRRFSHAYRSGSSQMLGWRLRMSVGGCAGGVVGPGRRRHWATADGLRAAGRGRTESRHGIGQIRVNLGVSFRTVSTA